MARIDMSCYGLPHGRWNRSTKWCAIIGRERCGRNLKVHAIAFDKNMNYVSSFAINIFAKSNFRSRDDYNLQMQITY